MMAERSSHNIDQCLFGYADGHRLLQSSIRLPPEVASDLTAASDLAPGARFASGEGYWTGFPVPKLARYGLMRTWQAFEMPRPGCVWSHLLLFKPELFEKVDDLAALASLVRRPSAPDDSAAYARPLSAPSLPDNEVEGTPTASEESSRSRIVEMLEVLYGGRDGPVEVSRPGELDELVLDIWSQQWPRLRRNFRFQTAATSSEESRSRRFDLQFRLGRGRSGRAALPDGGDSRWLSVAADDVGEGVRGPLRAFLRRYGQDVKRQRGSFRPLAGLFAAAEDGSTEHASAVPAQVVRSFPEPDDAATLKRDLVDGLIFANSQIDALLLFCTTDGARSLPAPTATGLRNLAEQWPSRAGDMIRLADCAARESGHLADALVSTVGRLVPVSEFWELTKELPELRRRMVANRPTLLDFERLGDLDSATLLTLLDAVPPGHDIGVVLVGRLSWRVDERVAKEVVTRFPEAAERVIELANTTGSSDAAGWLHALALKPSQILAPAIMRRVRRLSILLALVEALGWPSDNILEYGLGPWTAGLENAQDDLEQSERDRLEAFLFVLAVSAGGDQIQGALERSFPYLHGRIMHSFLTWPAYRILQPILPSAGFLREWDDGLKLRLAVTQAYVDRHLDETSFRGLLRDKWDRKMLRRAAEEIPGGKRFADAL